MKIYGPYTRKDGRQIVVLYDGKKTTTRSYPRLLTNPKRDQEVHHIDRNPSNNEFENLLNLNTQEHRKEHSTGQTIIEVVCVVCGNTVKRFLKHVNNNLKHNQNTHCSRSCAAKSGGIASGKSRRNNYKGES